MDVEKSFEVYLSGLPDHRFTRLSRDEVARMHRKARQAAAMRAYADEVRARAVHALVNGSDVASEVEIERTINAEAVVAGLADCLCGEDRGQPWPKLPVAAYLAPVQRWAGGPPELDTWYWDHNSF